MEDILIGGWQARDENGRRRCQAKPTSRVRIMARRDGWVPWTSGGTSTSARVIDRVGARWRCGWVEVGRIGQYAHQTNARFRLFISLLSLSFSSVPPGSLSPLKCSTPPAPVPPPTRRPVEFERPALSLPSTGGSDAGKAPAPRRTCRVLPACQFFLMPPLLLAAPD
jgi:hypothetical protein